jgi:hypothetical protein
LKNEINTPKIAELNRGYVVISDRSNGSALFVILTEVTTPAGGVTKRRNLTDNQMHVHLNDATPDSSDRSWRPLSRNDNPLF